MKASFSREGLLSGAVPGRGFSLPIGPLQRRTGRIGQPGAVWVTGQPVCKVGRLFISRAPPKDVLGDEKRPRPHWDLRFVPAAFNFLLRSAIGQILVDSVRV